MATGKRSSCSRTQQLLHHRNASELQAGRRRVNCRLLTYKTTSPIEVSSVQRSVQFNFHQPQIPCQAFKVRQNALADASLHKARQDKDRADFAPLKIKHSCRHRFSLNTPQIKVFFHQVAISVLSCPCRPDFQLCRGIGVDALHQASAQANIRPVQAPNAKKRWLTLNSHFNRSDVDLGHLHHRV